MKRITCFSTGLWPSSDNNGFDAIAEKLLALGDGRTIYVGKFQDDFVSKVYPFDWIDLVGHSFGFNALFDAAVLLGDSERLGKPSKIVQNLIALEPVHYWWAGGEWDTPDNVKVAVCLKKSFGLPPSFGFKNHNLNTTIPTWNHGNFPKNTEVAKSVFNILKQTQEIK